MSHEQEPTRRRFNSRIALQFLIVAVAACWLGWQWMIVRDRWALRQWLTANGGVAAVQVPGGEPGDYEHEIVTIPFWRSWIGDDPITCLYTPPLERAEIERLTKAFPESYGMTSATGANKKTPMP
ncbi:MAG TPA: hypothetical protein VGN12_20785 [Pirellulales bacterium]|jgi:hypothetical protein